MIKPIIKFLIVTLTLIFNFNASADTSDWKVSSAGETKVLQMRLTSSTEGTEGLKEIPISLEVITNPGWKIYWRYPGDSGLPTEINFNDSSNLNSFQIFWPAPFRFSTFGIDTFGYEGQIIFPINVIPEIENEMINLNTQISLLACNEICIPFQEEISLQIPKTASRPNINTRARAQFLSLVPRKIPIDKYSFGEVLLTKDGILLKNPKFPNKNFDIFVENDNGINFGKPIKKGNNFLLPKLNNDIYELKQNLLNFTFVSSDLSFEHQIILKKEIENKNLNTWFFEIIIYLIISFLGGLLLNIMPCVLPVISLKLTSIIDKNEIEIKKIRKSFLITSSGIISSFILLAATLISLKYFGHSISWGMQFQNSYFLFLMSLVILVFGLNMLNVFEIYLPYKILNLLSIKYQGNLDDFLRGFLTTLLATPCSAPFVGTAITFAFSESYLNMLSIFFFMSLGLAFPWLSIAIFPKTLSYLPSPGKWMVLVKYILGFGLLITSIWIFSIFLTSLNYNFNFYYQSQKDDHIITWEKGLANKLAKDGQVVLVDITADWCLTCKLNKYTIFNNKILNQEIKKGNIKFVQADWTLPDQKILDFLGENGRYGIPFNIVYGPKKVNGIVLPEVISVQSLLRVIEKVK
ncbi:MAG: protein-disulfide reductase DsbD family protein [Candidatus Puniceispirillales bacterium]